MVLQSTDAMLSSVLSNMTSEPFMNIELVLRVFHMIGEVIASKVNTLSITITDNYTKMSRNIKDTLRPANLSLNRELRKMSSLL